MLLTCGTTAPSSLTCANVSCSQRLLVATSDSRRDLRGTESTLPRVKWVYLDQNKWIDLSHAKHGLPAGKDYVDTRSTFCGYATEQRLVALPLSEAHLEETWKRGEPASRQRLGTTMFELAKLNRMAGPVRLVPHEVELACHLTLGRPVSRPTFQVFGQGLGHLYPALAIDFEPPASLDEATRSVVRQAAIATLERAAVVTPPFELPTHDIARPDDTYGNRYADGERDSAERLDAAGFNKDLVRRFVFASEILDIWKPLDAVLDRLGIGFGEIALSQESLTRFLELMPTRWMTAHLRRAAHENRSHVWHAHDLNDVAFLAIAVVHCDFVVTEKHWANYLARLPIPVPATVLTDLSSLPTHLAAG